MRARRHNPHTRTQDTHTTILQYISSGSVGAGTRARTLTTALPRGSNSSGLASDRYCASVMAAASSSCSSMEDSGWWGHKGAHTRDYIHPNNAKQNVTEHHLRCTAYRTRTHTVYAHTDTDTVITDAPKSLQRYTTKNPAKPTNSHAAPRTSCRLTVRAGGGEGGRAGARAAYTREGVTVWATINARSR